MCIFVSMFIETIQFILCLGDVETDDVIFNTFGYFYGRVTVVIFDKNYER